MAKTIVTQRYLFEYVDFDNLENRLASARTVVGKTVWAVDDAAAIADVVAMWANLRRHTYRGWDGDTYPQCPRLSRPIEVTWPD